VREAKTNGAKVTLRDVARLAQVHSATVSTVLNGAKGSTRVSEETSKRILQAAEELNYKVNRNAQQLKTQRSHVVGLLTGDLENPFFAHMVSVCSEELEKRGYDIILATRRQDENSDLHLLESLLSRQLAGVLLWSETLTEVREKVLLGSMSNVAIMGMEIPGYDSVAGVLEDGLESALDHLRDQGCTRIAYFAPYRTLNRPGDPRDRVYRAKMAEFGFQERVIGFHGTAYDIGAARTAAESLADDMAQMPSNERPDALFCFNDMNAFGAMMGLRRRGLRVPDDLALVGCDNLPLAMQLDVPLTTVAYPLEDVCRSAVRMLVDRIHTERSSDEQLPRKLEQLSTHLIVRESSLRKTCT